MPQFTHDDIQFNYYDSQNGDLALLVLHGLGGDAAGLRDFIIRPNLRRLAMDVRGHGQTTPLGPVEKLNFATLADDVIALFDHLGIDKAIVCGMSMGAAISLAVGLRHPDRVHGLILSAPAWVNAPMPMEALYHAVAELLDEYPDGLAAWAAFQETHHYADMLAISPPIAASLVMLFTDPHTKENAAKYKYIASSQPFDTVAELEAMQLPTRIIAAPQDPIHPYEFGEILAAHIPHGELISIVGRSTDEERHNEEGYQAIVEFVEKFTAP